MAPPFRVAEFDIMYGHGISTEGTLLDIASNMEIIKKSGAWYSYNGERIGQGRENAKQYLISHPEVMSEIEKIVRDTLVVEPEQFDDTIIANRDEET